MNITRKTILKTILSITILLVLLKCTHKGETSPENVLDHSVFKEARINHITPTGWLRAFLMNQRNGLTGHKEIQGNPFDTEGWSAPRVTNNQGAGEWWPYEQTAYWIDGALRCGYLLNDSFLINQAQKHTGYVLGHPAEDGYLGSEVIREERWPHAVFFRSLIAQFSATRDSSILQKLTRHFLEEGYAFTGGREEINIETMIWVYHRTGNTELLNLAKEIYEHFEGNPDDQSISVVEEQTNGMPTSYHGVSYVEYAKLGAIMYSATAEKRYLDHTRAALDKIEKYHMLPDGLFVSAEEMKPTDDLNGHETCNLSDYTWTLGYMLMVTGEVKYADMIEKACFNAVPGAVTPDFKAFQYFSSANQVICTPHSNTCDYNKGRSLMQYAPNPWDVDCCAGNVHRAMPNFGARIWMRDQQDGVVAAMYSPSEINFIYQGNDVHIRQLTNYPFSDTIKFVFDKVSGTAMPFTLRVPEWCCNPVILVNDEKTANVKTGTYHQLTRDFAIGDEVTVVLPSKVKMTAWPGKSAVIEKGPLVYALDIKERYERDAFQEEQNDTFPAYRIYPESDWNYALITAPENIIEESEFIRGKMTDNPWRDAPLKIRVPAKKIRGWNIKRSSKTTMLLWSPNGYVEEINAGNFEFTPELPNSLTVQARLSEKSELVTLVPYGATRLRICMFPYYCSPNNLKGEEVKIKDQDLKLN